MDMKKVAQGLGVFSIGLGLMEVLSPGKLESMLGIQHKRTLLRSFGMREIGSGGAILMDPSDSKRVWSRVGGDALDIAALVAAMPKSYRRNGVIFALANVLAVTGVDIWCAMELQKGGRKRRGNLKKAA